jgi:hypothetical protein
LPEWPRLTEPELDLLLDRIEERFESLAPALIEQQVAGRMLRGALKTAATVAKPRMLRYVRDTILSELIRRDQIAEWEIPGDWLDLPGDIDPDAIRLVLAALANPGFDYRTVAGIAVVTQLPEHLVIRILELGEAQDDRPYRVVRASGTDDAGNALYTLASRRPGWFRRSFGKVSADSDGMRVD